MITTDYWKLHHPDNPMAASYGTLAKCEEWRDRLPIVAGRARDTYLIERVPCCHCCGDDYSAVRERNGCTTQWPNGQVRCDKHHDRNPCAIEGCKRTREAPADAKGNRHMADDQTMCGEHWRRYVPPRSRLRRQYQAYWRQAKKHGWAWRGKRGRSARLDWRFRRFWDALVALARRRATEGHLDEAEIARLFGWDEPGG